MVKFLAIVVLIGVAFADISAIPKNLETSNFLDDRIIGGEDTSIEEVPYQVSIGINGRHYCGGSIIDKYWILTAGHCANYPNRLYTIHAGSEHISLGGTSHRVSLVMSHENYTTDSYGIPSNDIALFRVSKPFALDKTRRAIGLYDKNEEIEAGTCSVITGWGTTFPGANLLPRKLQIVRVPIISDQECQKAYSNAAKISPGQICATHPQGGKDACQGDSGGPLVVGGRLAGVVSWGRGCAIVGYPGVYTKVAYFREWINGTMKS